MAEALAYLEAKNKSASLASGLRDSQTAKSLGTLKNHPKDGFFQSKVLSNSPQ
jgi:hypothetical protein